MLATLHETLKGCRRNSLLHQMELFDQYAPKMKSVCLRYINHNHEAEEAMLVAFASAFSKIQSLKQDDLVETWLKDLMVKTCCQITKKSIGNIPPTKQAFESKTLASKISASKTQAKKAYVTLKGYARIVFTLVFVDKYSTEDASRFLGMPEEECLIYLHNAKSTVLGQLEKISHPK